MNDRNTFLNALVGAVVTVVTVSFIPFSPVAGGLVSGYLEGGETEDALKVGALSGVLALVPAVLLFVVIGNIAFALIAGGTTAPGAVGGIGLFVLFAAFAFFLLYVVMLSAVGGWVGLYLKNELGT